MATPVWQPGTLYQPGDLVQPASAPPALFTPIVNPGFESGTLTGWTSSDGNFQILTNRVFTGTYCCRYAGANTESAPAYIEQSAFAPVNPGTSITAYCQVDQSEAGSNPSEAGGWIALAWYTSGDVLISVSEGNRIRTGNGGHWQQSTVTAVAPATAAKVKVRAYAYKILAGGGNNDKPGLDAFVWSQSYAPIGDTVVYEATQTNAAISAATEPVWPGEGNTVVDGGVTWLGVEASRVTWQASPILVSGAVEPAFSTVAGASVQDNTIIWISGTGFLSEAPQSPVTLIAASKVFAGDDDIVPYCATVNPLDWTTAQDAGYLPFGIQIYGSNPVAAMGLFRGNLMVFNSEGFQMWQIDEDPALMALLDGAPIGCIYPRSVQSVGGDLFVLTSQGVRNIAIAAGATNLQAGTFGDAVDPLIKAAVTTGVTPRSVYFPAMGQYWLAFGATVYVLSMYKRKASWARYVFPEAITDFTLAGDLLYMRTASHKVLQLSDAALVDDGGATSAVTITIASPGVVTWASHGMSNGDTVSFTTTGALPTGLTAGVSYYVVNKTTDTFQVALTAGGAVRNTTGSQSGVHTAAFTGVEFEGVLQWPWIDLGNIGVQKTLEGFDLVGTGEVSVSVGYNQKDVNAYTTPYLIEECDTLTEEPIPLPLSAPSYSLKLTFSGGQAWEWQAANLYASDNRGGGARG